MLISKPTVWPLKRTQISGGKPDVIGNWAPTWFHVNSRSNIIWVKMQITRSILWFIFFLLGFKINEMIRKKGHIQVQGDPMAAVSSGQMWFPRRLRFTTWFQIYPLVSSAPWFAGKSPGNRSIILPAINRTMVGAVYFQLLNHPYPHGRFQKYGETPSHPKGFNTKMD